MKKKALSLALSLLMALSLLPTSVLTAVAEGAYQVLFEAQIQEPIVCGNDSNLIAYGDTAAVRSVTDDVYHLIRFTGNGVEQIPGEYADVSGVGAEYFVAGNEDGLKGVFDKQGNQVVDYRYTEMRFTEDKGLVKGQIYTYVEDGEDEESYYLVDIANGTASEITKRQYYADKNGCLVEWSDELERHQVVDVDGNVILSFADENCRIMEMLSSDSGGLVSIWINGVGDWKVANFKGEEVTLNTHYDMVNRVCDGYLCASDFSDGTSIDALLDIKGNEVVPYGQYFRFSAVSPDGLVWAEDSEGACALLKLGKAAATVQANPTNDKLTVNGVEQNPTVYKIGDSNYFKIRDLAAVLNGTGKQFSVGYDAEKQSVTAAPGQPYELTGTELAGATDSSQTAQASNDAIYVNGQRVEAEVYKIDGSNYFKLRDLGAALGFEVNWTAERGMTIETGGGSQPTEKTPLEQIQGIWYGKDEEVQGEANEQEYKIEGDRLFQISYIDMYYYMEGTIVGIELEDGLYAIKLKDCKGINVSTSDTTIYDRGSWKEDTIYLDLQSNMLTDVTLDIVLSPASALQLYPRFQAALEAAQNKPNSYTMTTADAYNKLLPLYNKELDATEAIVYSIGSVSYIAITNAYVGGADSKLAIELTKLRNHVLTARSYLEEESVGMLAICDQAPGFEKVKPILLNIKERLDNIQAVTESSGKVDPDELLAQSEAIIAYWGEFRDAMQEIYDKYN